jgi:hypothetical protein
VHGLLGRAPVVLDVRVLHEGRLLLQRVRALSQNVVIVYVLLVMRLVTRLQVLLRVVVLKIAQRLNLYLRHSSQDVFLLNAQTFGLVDAAARQVLDTTLLVFHTF